MRLSSQHVILRCSLHDEESGTVESVIVKQVTATEFTSGGSRGPSHRFLNEAVALEFLNATARPGPWPTLISSGLDERVLILEDVGSHQTVQEVLLADDAVQAEEALARMGSALGAMHAATADRIAEFEERRAKFGVSPILSDSTRDLRADGEAFARSFDHFGVEVHPGFMTELAALEDSLDEPSAFPTVIHADAGPQNFIDTDLGAVMIDFEFMSPGSALLDLVSARLGFPHSEDGRRIPDGLVDVVEERYRAAAVVSMPGIADGDLFEQALVDACAHWALGRWARLWSRLFVTPFDQTPVTEMQQSQTLSIYEGFTRLADAVGRREMLAKTLSDCVAAVRRVFPELERSPYYDCFE